ncbi:hypothetical protein [Paraglaciecola aestuariivivens]
MTYNKTIQNLLLGSIALGLSGCIIHVGGNKDSNGDYSSVFGGVEIEANREVGDLSSVNGNIEISDNSSAKDLDAVNGNIHLGKNVSVVKVSTVNGNIEANKNLRVKADVSTVNGTVELAKGAEIGGDVTTVNGDILLTQSLVKENVRTKNGSIYLTHNTQVNGDLEFESPEGNGWWSEKERKHNPPKLIIDASSNVAGRIILRQKVVLEIANTELLDKVEHKY